MERDKVVIGGSPSSPTRRNPEIRRRPTLKPMLTARYTQRFNFTCQLSLTIISLPIFAASSWPYYANYRLGHTQEENFSPHFNNFPQLRCAQNSRLNRKVSEYMRKQRNLVKNILQNVWVNGKRKAYGSTRTLHIAPAGTV